MLRSKQNEGDSSILVSNLYISKCHAKCKHWELYKLDKLYSLINLIKLDKLYRTEKEKGNGIYVISTNLKFKNILCLHWAWGGFHVMCRERQEKIPNKKWHHEWVDVFLIFQLMIKVSGLYLS